MCIKPITGLLLSLLSSLLITAVALYPYNKTSTPAPTSQSETSSIDTEFVRLCSGLDVAGEQTTLIATANCLGRIRGYVDSHIQTVHMLQQRFVMSYTVQLWCIPRDITDKQLMTDVTVWIAANPVDYATITGKFAGTSGAMGVTAAALRATYPCATTSVPQIQAK